MNELMHDASLYVVTFLLLCRRVVLAATHTVFCEVLIRCSTLIRGLETRLLADVESLSLLLLDCVVDDFRVFGDRFILCNLRRFEHHMVRCDVGLFQDFLMLLWFSSH